MRRRRTRTRTDMRTFFDVQIKAPPPPRFSRSTDDRPLEVLQFGKESVRSLGDRGLEEIGFMMVGACLRASVRVRACVCKSPRPVRSCSFTGKLYRASVRPSSDWPLSLPSRDSRSSSLVSADTARPPSLSPRYAVPPLFPITIRAEEEDFPILDRRCYVKFAGQKEPRSRCGLSRPQCGWGGSCRAQRCVSC